MAGENAAQIVQPMTVELALANAARLLYNAEVTTDQALMQRIEGLADSWVGIARLLTERDS